MAILFIPGKFDPTRWINAIKKIDAQLDIRVWPNSGDPRDIDFALVWHYPPKELQKYPNLKCICSLGAGVDHIMDDPYLPKDIDIVRIVDPLLVRDMTQYIIGTVIHFTREFDIYQKQQKQKKWLQHLPNNEINIGIMGLGQLGSDTVKKLMSLGFSVNGWSRTPKKIAGLKNYHGKKEFNQFLSKSTVLINLLPLTAETKNILNRDTFYCLPKGAYIINVGRGGHLVDADLIQALNAGQLSGACLDVFREEPLPTTHPFWQHSKIIVTPHIASVTNPKSVAIQVIENYKRLLAKKPLLHKVNIKQGY